MRMQDTDNRTTPFGPFDVHEFLQPPSTSTKKLTLENFSLRYKNNLIGLDSIHPDNEERATRMRTHGLKWRGSVCFAIIEGNRKQISPHGMELLLRGAEANGREVDWEAGFFVDLIGAYYRHAVELGS